MNPALRGTARSNVLAGGLDNRADSSADSSYVSRPCSTVSGTTTTSYHARAGELNHSRSNGSSSGVGGWTRSASSTDSGTGYARLSRSRALANGVHVPSQPSLRARSTSSRSTFGYAMELVQEAEELERSIEEQLPVGRKYTARDIVQVEEARPAQLPRRSARQHRAHTRRPLEDSENEDHSTHLDASSFNHNALAQPYASNAIPTGVGRSLRPRAAPAGRERTNIDAIASWLREQPYSPTQNAGDEVEYERDALSPYQQSIVYSPSVAKGSSIRGTAGLADFDTMPADLPKRRRVAPAERHNSSDTSISADTSHFTAYTRHLRRIAQHTPQPRRVHEPFA
ncbi:hypothetical protein THASP1DRAFT_28152 [Thamnocephalis sphaerospora]|uniref:Uncharacterized protein n=1 Tax=Thamnocephalis sphaerospora TaxID=78915 RepID=A0A4P9XX96_9FUNG|nr:hypothetical protein THASP1DRAFT_28152 [Thamnocephalis sphaerospora]|eukprot:RKP10070.1 hypothetical protein THASP1DRAFT_28152 [Thamnocephalis sphaerospora]